MIEPVDPFQRGIFDAVDTAPRITSADLGLELEPHEDHSAYIESWLQVLRADRRAMVSTAAHAQRAVDYLNGLQAPAEDAAA